MYLSSYFDSSVQQSIQEQPPSINIAMYESLYHSANAEETKIYIPCDLSLQP